MFKYLVLMSLFAIAMAGIIHDHHHHEEEPPQESEHHHEIEHKHAISHQSFKIHHFHPVPVYIKKEDQQFLKHPVEIGGSKHKLKVLHPETEHHHGHGLTLENHSEFEHKGLDHHHSFDGHQGGSDSESYSGHDFGHHEYHDINVHHGHHE